MYTELMEEADIPAGPRPGPPGDDRTRSGGPWRWSFSGGWREACWRNGAPAIARLLHFEHALHSGFLVSLEGAGEHKPALSLGQELDPRGPARIQADDVEPGGLRPYRNVT